MYSCLKQWNNCTILYISKMGSFSLRVQVLYQLKMSKGITFKFSKMYNPITIEYEAMQSQVACDFVIKKNYSAYKK